MNAYYNENDISKKTLEDKATDAACSLIDVITNQTFLTVLKVVLITAALFGFVSVVGMIDDGSIGYLSGIGICTLLSVAEIFVIRSLIKQRG